MFELPTLAPLDVGPIGPIITEAVLEVAVSEFCSRYQREPEFVATICIPAKSHAGLPWEGAHRHPFIKELAPVGEVNVGEDVLPVYSRGGMLPPEYVYPCVIVGDADGSVIMDVEV